MGIMHRTGYHQEGRHAPAPAAALLLALCLLVAGAQALTIPIDDAALAAGADEIVRGEITGVHAGWTADHTQIVTTASVRVKGRAKGSGADTLTLSVPGGTVENVTQWVEDQPTLLPGTEAFVFVKHGGEGDRVYGGQRGIVPVEQGRVRGNARTKGGGVPADAYGRYLGELAAGRAAAAPASEPAPRAAAATTPVIARVSPDTASAGTGTTITITGTGFGTKASRESYADVGFVQRFFPVSPIWASGAPHFSNNVNDVVSWSDTEIVVRVPTGVTGDWYPGSASSGYVWVITDQNVTSLPVPTVVGIAMTGAVSFLT
jgi:hypothetical protein